MEKVTKKIKKQKFDKIKFEYLLLGYEIIEKKEDEKYVYLTFVRDLNNDQLNECLLDYKKYKRCQIPPLFPILICIPIALVFITLFLIFTLTNDDPLTYLLSFFLPGVIFFLLGSGYSLFRMNRINNHIQDKGETLKKLEEKILKRSK